LFFQTPAAIAGMTTSPQLRESPETAKFQVASLLVGAWAAAEVCASAALGNPLKIRVASSNPRFLIPWVIESPLGAFLCAALRCNLRKSFSSNQPQSQKI
jgi:hypothetical protein